MSISVARSDTCVPLGPRRFAIVPHELAQRISGHEESITLANHTVLASPGLSVTQTESKGVRLLLLGEALDPTEPTRTNLDILHSLLTTTPNSFEDIATRTSTLSGRWLLIATHNDATALIPDMSNMRVVFYSFKHSCGICASDPLLIATLLQLPVDPKADEFRHSPVFSARQCWWIGTKTLYSDVFRLLPNHYLDLATRETPRFWPNQPRTLIPVEKAIQKASGLLKGGFAAAIARFGRIALPISAGLDSRLLLAASREFKDNIHYFIGQHRNMTDDHVDIQVPKRLTSALGLPFHVHRFEKDYMLPYLDPYLSAYSLARTSHLFMCYRKYQDWPEDINVLSTGNLSEISRARHQGKSFTLSPRNLAGLTGYNCRHARQAVALWHAEANPYAARFDYFLGDLLHWELKMGSWGTDAFAETDYDHETFLPYNCRQYHESLLGTDYRYRNAEHPILFYDMIKSMWPETLTEPINPVPHMSFRRKLKLFLRQRPFVFKLRSLAIGYGIYR